MTEKIELDDFSLANLKTILEVLKKDGIKRVEITYYGSGDEGQTDGIVFYPENVVSTKMINVERRIKYNSPETTTVSEPVNAVLFDIGWDIVDQSIHSGFHNGDGGGGTITICVETQIITMAHYDNIMSIVEYDKVEFELRA